MAPLPGLSDLYGPAPVRGSTGREASNWGRPPDPRHRVPGDASGQGPAPVAVHGREIDTDEIPPLPLPGLPTNRTPGVHSAPYPAGATQDLTRYSEQMRALHGRDLGGTAWVRGVATPYRELVESGRYDSPNGSVLAGGVPDQLRGGQAGTDVDQGFGREPGYGFAFGRQFRRFFKGPVPLDRTGTVHDERPFLGHHPVRQNLLNNGGPYYQAGDISSGMMMGPTPVGSPTPYTQPPNPQYRSTGDYEQEAGYSDGWVAG